ncbi:CNNM domain-containing protein [Desulfoluna butyratoxydans]|uniref:Cbs domain n=1 Tax=Desulfoluna butyratoxydans TaxID=231438 RepID=A0A4V6IL87_9BACT|nr:CNNM domain-containing protein [Desulfoluna butyratoxydans]VFQ44168.1 cbs domain [Desulfoluna butyratoxydans]
MTLLFVYIFIALFFSFACSMMEAVLLSIPHSYIGVVEKKSPKAGKRLNDYKQNIDRPLAAILSLNTIAHTVGAAGAGAQAAAVFGSQYVGVISAVLTLLILIVSEIIPKSLGATYWKQLAGTVSLMLSYLIPPMLPFVWISKYITRLFSPETAPHTFSREEFSAMAELGEKSGEIKKQEARILRSLFRFNSLRVKDIMTPRTVVFALKQEMLSEQVLEAHPHIIFSRIPLYCENLDTITGYVMKNDILLASAKGEEAKPLSELKRDIITVQETISLTVIFDFLLTRQEHISLVVDEYGGTAGIITMEDIIETLLGMEIMDEVDTIADMQALARSQWEERTRRMLKDKQLDHSEKPVYVIKDQ